MRTKTAKMIKIRQGKTKQDKQRRLKFTLNLLNISNKTKKEKQIRLREPDLLMVITGGAMAYSRPDGVKVIPLGCMRD